MNLEQFIEFVGRRERALSAADVARFQNEKLGGRQLDPEYARFLAAAIGRHVFERISIDGVALYRIFGLSPETDSEASLASALNEIEVLCGDRSASGLLPIAASRAGDWFCFVMTPMSEGVIMRRRFVPDNTLPTAGADEVVAASFAQLLQETSEFDPRDPSTVLYDQAMELFQRGEPAAALARWRDSWEVSPHAGTAFRIGTALRFTGRVSESVDWLAHAYRLNPRNSRFATTYAEALHERGQLDESIATLNAVLSRNKSYLPAKRALDRIVRDMRDASQTDPI